MDSFLLNSDISLPKISSLPISKPSATRHLQPSPSTRSYHEDISLQLPPLCNPHQHHHPIDNPTRILPSSPHLALALRPTENASSSSSSASSHDSLIQRLREFSMPPTSPISVPNKSLRGRKEEHASKYNHVHEREKSISMSPITPPAPLTNIFISEGEEKRKENLKAKGKRPYKCEICGFRFIKKDHAMKHWKVVHLKERPFTCHQCNSKFGQRSDLNKHFRSVHLRIKPFQCVHCGLKFSHRGNQIRHQSVVHEKKKPFTCHLCSFQFAEKSNLSKHLLAVHKISLPQQSNLLIPTQNRSQAHTR